MRDEKRTNVTGDPSGRFPLTRQNYKLLLIGFCVIVLGFLLMIGGNPEDPLDFSPAIFDFRRITLAPMLVLVGFLFEIFAIMYRGRRSKTDANKE
jgi:hypothetical protein